MYLPIAEVSIQVVGLPTLQCDDGQCEGLPLHTVPFSHKFQLLPPTGKDKLLMKHLNFLYCRL